MKDKYLCVIAQFDNETEQKLKEIQNILLYNGFNGKQTQNIRNHITLGTFDVSQEEFIKEKVEMVAQKLHKFNINLSSIGLFGLDVLFISPSVNRELLDLHQYFNNNSINELVWTPHSTLLIDDNKNILKALPLVADSFKGFTAIIESISLYEFFPTRFILEKSLL